MNMKIVQFVTIVIMILCHSGYLLAQKPWEFNKEDPFWDPHCPLMDMYTVFMFRQKSCIDGYQVIVETRGGAVDNYSYPDSRSHLDYRMESFIPLLRKQSFHSMIGLSFMNSSFLLKNHSNILESNLYSIWTWLAIQYTIEKWRFSLTSEYYRNGDNNSVHKQLGDKFMPIFVAAYEFSPQWQLYLLGGYEVKFMYEKLNHMPLGGFQLRYVPSNRLKFLFGAPTVFAIEWNMFHTYDISFDFFIVNRETNFMIRKRFTSDFSLAANYNSSWNRSNITFFEKKNYIPMGSMDTVSFSNISQMRHSLSLDFGIRLQKFVGTMISLGYTIGEPAKLYENTVFKENVSGRNEMFAKVLVQFLKPD